MATSGANRVERQFRGQARLIRLLLWKIGESIDIDAGLKVAVDAHMIDSEDASFLRECLDAEERDRDSENLSLPVTAETISRLRRCADKLNRADSA